MQTNHQQIIQSPDVSGQPNIQARTVCLNATEAAKLLERCAYRGQRKIRAREVARYSLLMKRGLWRSSVIHIAVLGDQEFITDGQHRLESVVATDTVQSFLVVYTVCRDDVEVAREYAAHGGGYIRNPKDYLNASGVMERLEISKTQLGLLQSASKILLTQFSPQPAQYIVDNTGIDLELIIEEYANAYVLYADAIRGAHKDLAHILRWASVMAVGMETFQHTPTEADQFWRALATGSLSFPQIVNLERALLPYANNKAQGGKNKRPSPAFIARTAAAAWNGWNVKPHAKEFKHRIQPVSEPIFIFGSEKFSGKQQSDPMAASLQMFAGLADIQLSCNTSPSL